MVFFTSNRRYYVEMKRLELSIVCVQSRCIPNYATSPLYCVDLPRIELGTFTMPWCCSTNWSYRPGVSDENRTRVTATTTQRSSIELQTQRKRRESNPQGLLHPSCFLNSVPRQWQRFQKSNVGLHAAWSPTTVTLAPEGG